VVTARAPDPRGRAEEDPATQSTRPQRDEATDTVPSSTRARDPSYAGQKLPHERDESAEGDTSAERDAQGTRPRIEQGADDAQSERQDTDCYNATAPRFDKGQSGSR
jgi:hypothetical protein